MHASGRIRLTGREVQAPRAEVNWRHCVVDVIDATLRQTVLNLEISGHKPERAIGAGQRKRERRPIFVRRVYSLGQADVSRTRRHASDQTCYIPAIPHAVAGFGLTPDIKIGSVRSNEWIVIL